MISTLPQLFARNRPDRSTVLLDVPGGLTLTYGDVDALTAQVAYGLMSAGVGVGDRVAVQMEKAPEVIVVYLACLRLGAVFIPMNPAYTEAEVQSIAADASPAVLIRSVPEVLSLAEGQPVEFVDHDPAADDPAVILYTSGTTGTPKGAVLSQRNLASNAATLHEAWGFRPDDVLLHVLPVFHAHGLFVAMNCVLANGTSAVFLPRFDVDAVVAELPRCTVMMGVPTHYTRLLEDGRFDAHLCAGMRLFVSGSAPLLATTHEEFRARTGHVILERYGMTETVMLTSNPLDGERKPGTVGPPLAGVDVRLADIDDGGVGGIEVRGPNVFGGYWGRPDLAATEFTDDGWFRTGDLGTIDADGYVTIVGRSKDLVITGGLNVYPKEVELVLDAIDGVLESAVIGLPHPDFGEQVVAVVVPEPGAVVDSELVRDAARRSLAGYKVPKQVVVVDELPRNALGKVEKAKLKQSLA